MLRNIMLRAAANAFLVARVSGLGRRLGLARRFTAGETLEEAIPVVRELHRAGLMTTLDLLGEGVRDENEARRATQAYINLLQSIRQGAIDSTISIKLTQLGLDIRPEFCEANLSAILQSAVATGNFVRIDMESSRYTQMTIDLFRRGLQLYGPRHVGIVIQAYLYRSEQDVRDLCRLDCNIRLCKGAYMEPPEVAFPRKKDVDRNFLSLVDLMLDSPVYSAVATHDEKMIRHVQAKVSRGRVAEDRFEFQMLFGVRRERQLALRAQGYRMKIYVPYGTQWAPYFMRRLAERPANLLFIARNFFRR